MRPIHERFAVFTDQWIRRRTRILLENGSYENVGEAYLAAVETMQYAGRTHHRTYDNWFRWRHPRGYQDRLARSQMV
jgi:hypothetical protein